MELANLVIANLFSSAVVLTTGTYFFKQVFNRLLDKRMESFKQQLQVDSKTRELALRSQIDFRERQLGEYYGPIYAYLMRGKPIYRLQSEGQLDDISESIEALFVSANEAIVAMILQKSHLVAGERMPVAFTDFLTHVAVWHGFMSTTGGGVPLSKDDFPEAYYPIEFEEEIFATTERLKKELFELHNQHGSLGHSER